MHMVFWSAWIATSSIKMDMKSPWTWSLGPSELLDWFCLSMVYWMTWKLLQNISMCFLKFASNNVFALHKVAQMMVHLQSECVWRSNFRGVAYCKSSRCQNISPWFNAYKCLCCACLGKKNTSCLFKKSMSLPFTSTDISRPCPRQK